MLISQQIETPIGTMLAIANDEALVALRFIDNKNLELELKSLQTQTKSIITQGPSKHLTSIAQELQAYFAGTLQEFKTPLFLAGTLFQTATWQALRQIPYGKKISYAQLAQKVGNAKAHRAVGTANGANRFSIIIPCHRVITSNGKLGGYNGGLERKQWLLDHEQKRTT